MAIDLLEAETLRQIFNSPSADSYISEQPFHIAQSICNLQNSTNEEEFQEILLRSLEYRNSFGESKKIINALIRESGLFPFLETDRLNFADRIAYEFHRPENFESIVFHRPQARIYRELLNSTLSIF